MSPISESSPNRQVVPGTRNNPSRYIERFSSPCSIRTSFCNSAGPRVSTSFIKRFYHREHGEHRVIVTADGTRDLSIGSCLQNEDGLNPKRTRHGPRLCRRPVVRIPWASTHSKACIPRARRRLDACPDGDRRHGPESGSVVNEEDIFVGNDYVVGEFV